MKTRAWKPAQHFQTNVPVVIKDPTIKNTLLLFSIKLENSLTTYVTILRKKLLHCYISTIILKHSTNRFQETTNPDLGICKINSAAF